MPLFPRYRCHPFYLSGRNKGEQVGSASASAASSVWTPLGLLFFLHLWLDELHASVHAPDRQAPPGMAQRGAQVAAGQKQARKEAHQDVFTRIFRSLFNFKKMFVGGVRRIFFRSLDASFLSCRRRFGPRRR